MSKIPNENFQPTEGHLAVLTNPARFKVLVWHRKSRKTTLAINELIRWAGAIKGTYWYLAPYLSQAKKIVWQDPEMLEKYCPPEIWATRNNSELYLTFPNGSKLYILGADNPDSLRGPNPKGVILDEFDDMRSEIWSAIIQPIMIANPNSWCWFVGTPKGRRELFKKYNYAREQMAEKQTEWFASRLRATDTSIISEKDLEEAKRTTTQDFFRQEYEVEFLEGAGVVFRNVDKKVWEGTLIPNQKHMYKLGIDLAKVNDYTVITPIDLCTFKVGHQERFNQIDYNLQKSRIEVAYLKFFKPRTTLDSTGVGEPIFDDLVQTRISRLEAFHFTEQSKRDLLTNLQLKLEQGKIWLPNDEQLLNELKAMQYELTRTGKTTMKVPEGVHDDCVMSLALCVWDMPDGHVPEKRNEQLEDLKQFDAIRRRSKGAYFTGSPRKG